MTTHKSTFSLASVIDEVKLDRTNFLEWYRFVRIILKSDGKDYVLEKALPEKLRPRASHAEYDAWNKHYNDMVEVRQFMLDTMSSALREQYEKVESPIELITSLKLLFQEHVRIEKYDSVKSLFRCKLPEGSPVSPHVIEMMGHVHNLEKLDCPIDQKLAIDIILQSLPSSFDEFVMKFFKCEDTVSLTELHEMLKAAEIAIKRRNRSTNPGKDKKKGKTIRNDESESSVRSRDPVAGIRCRYCLKLGHWKRDCEKFLEDEEEIKMMYPNLLQGSSKGRTWGKKTNRPTR